jgi:hypothetical protein
MEARWVVQRDLLDLAQRRQDVSESARQSYGGLTTASRSYVNGGCTWKRKDATIHQRAHDPSATPD